MDFLAGGCIPDADGTIGAGGGDQLAVRREGNTVGGALVPQAQAAEADQGALGQGIAVQIGSERRLRACRAAAETQQPNGPQGTSTIERHGRPPISPSSAP